MAHYAFIDGHGLVSEVITGRDESDLATGVTSWEHYYGVVRGLQCLQTSYNTLGGVHYTDGEPSADQTQALRFHYAGIGFLYDVARDAFIPPQPYPSWVLDESTCQWVAPVPKPDGDYVWDERAGDWVEA
jgi:hypothetical protein